MLRLRFATHKLRRRRKSPAILAGWSAAAFTTPPSKIPLTDCIAEPSLLTRYTLAQSVIGLMTILGNPAKDTAQSTNDPASTYTLQPSPSDGRLRLQQPTVGELPCFFSTRVT